ncbi:MAG: hypothetical protein KDB22_24315, partial [Planctomycetales bacterium]|nr:hypothetical protein [Planctomycetales bacterium]
MDSKSFGLVIAYLLPGFVLLAGLGHVSEIAWNWLYGEAASQFLSVGGFLYSTVAALTLGLLASTVRWLLIDSLHHATGLRRPSWNFGRLEGNLGSYMTLVENHYRYYQFYANGTIAWSVGYCCWRLSTEESVGFGSDLAAICLTVLLF